MIMLSTRTSILLGALLLMYAIGRTFAGDQVATFTQMEGKVTVFSHPSKTLPKSSPTAPEKASHALFEGEYFLVKPAQVGDSVENGNIVRTAPNAKARVVYPNGDQINVGPGTAYRTHWNDSQPKAQQPQWNLMYGKVRGVIEKGGPRSMLKVKTRTAVMGVRGTDFFVAERGQDGSTEVSILRGAVELKPSTPKAKPIQVETGYSAAVAPPPPVTAPRGRPTPQTLEPSPQVELRKTTREDLAGIQKTSHIEKAVASHAPASSAPQAAAVEAQVRQLEAKASQAVLKDIQLHDPKLYASLSKHPERSAEDLNQASLLNVMKDAPKAPAHRKPTLSELESLEEGAYDRYFKTYEE